ncbi:alpha/beta fold hydrolase [bacterium]|nr:alpha/beta fold hydrolase [bacterium]
MEKYKLITKDRVEIAINHYNREKDEVVVIAPGWCMTKDSNAFSQISEMFAKHFDVISFDFRGHGESGGFYTFSAKEIIDLDAVIRYSRKKYKKIYLAGFSLGAAVSIIYASKSRFIDKIIAVSPPADFDKIENQMWKKAAWGETFKKFELGRFASIRPYPIPLKKIKPIDVVDKIKIPALFICGEKDPTVHPWHTKNLYDKAICYKKYKEYQNGYHAEDLFLHFNDDFTDTCINWLLDK